MLGNIRTTADILLIVFFGILCFVLGGALLSNRYSEAHTVQEHAFEQTEHWLHYEFPLRIRATVKQADGAPPRSADWHVQEHQLGGQHHTTISGPDGLLIELQVFAQNRHNYTDYPRKEVAP